MRSRNNIQLLIISTLISILLYSCKKELRNEKLYRAINLKSNDTAFLKLIEIENQFIGKYLVIYKDRTFDLGNLSGEIIGDTLKGKNKYVSRRKSNFTKPIIFIKANENLKLGTGMVSYYSQIPFYANGSIQFPDSLFYFTPIESKNILHLKNNYQF